LVRLWSSFPADIPALIAPSADTAREMGSIFYIRQRSITMR